jgi:hypothetical protein
MASIPTGPLNDSSLCPAFQVYLRSKKSSEEAGFLVAPEFGPNQWLVSILFDLSPELFASPKYVVKVAHSTSAGICHFFLFVYCIIMKIFLG